ncbi:ribose 5-phosphate isomerase B [Thermodesulfobacterium hveragerdense]|uniref:ribose 5-phosphate isomerase B n=1 Tax=Thermodesulfobacterium hveragerdense TaxID=53424 RepID=UPI00041FD806|nr:ribose 5-phosphate isomerase B [Thermodesulfobacterium hveragerdense]
MKIAIASDHAGYFLKEKIKDFLAKEGHEVVDVGCYSHVAVDYPEYGVKAVEKVLQGEVERGILICGTGIGMSIVANRFSGIRAALCHEPFSAKMARLHNDANVLVLGGRMIGDGMAVEIVKTFLETPFEGGRHERRLELIEKLKNLR